ncbi:MAG: hypothetical protein ACI8TQ_000780 [Planctomycetota bacterium]|jgi:uncharacterized protein YheU (UPF0270 family)
MDESNGIRIPAEELSADALRGLIEEFVTRDGTEFTDSNKKIERVEFLLKRGEVEIWFNQESGTCSIQLK